WSCVEARTRRPPAMRARAIAISSIRRRAGSSAGLGSWTMLDECACQRATTGVEDGCADRGCSSLRTRRRGFAVCARRHCRLDGAAQAATPEILLRPDRCATVRGYHRIAGILSDALRAADPVRAGA